MNIDDEVPKIDTTKPHPARRYNWWLGGKDNYEADRESGAAIAAIYPQVITDVQANRDWTHRAVRALAETHGVRQFLDIGTGLPTEPHVHDIAQEVDPTSRVVYLDNDPLVMVHARALLVGTPEGETAYAEVDMRDPDLLLKHPDVRNTLDFDRPIAVMLAAVLHFVEDDEQARNIVRRLVDELPSGSYLAISSFTTDDLDESTRNKIDERLGAKKDGPFQPRSLDQFATFFTGLTLIDPGICPVNLWRPGPDDASEHASVYAGVARKGQPS